jgi:hypothetical protein
VRIDIWREPYCPYFKIIDHDAKMEFNVVPNDVWRNYGPTFSLGSDMVIADWDEVERETNFTKEIATTEFLLGAKEF